MVGPITGGLTQPGSKDLIIRGGHNIDPQMIEEALHKPSAVALAAAEGKPDEKAGELPVVYVLLKPALRFDAIARVYQAVVAELHPAARVEVLGDDKAGQLAHIHLPNGSQALTAAIGERLAGYAVGHRIHFMH